MSCPVCDSNNIKRIIKLDCGNFDNSYLYKIAKIYRCNDCNHVFNYLSNKEIFGLKKYYDNEYAQINLSHNKGDMYSQEQYKNIIKMLTSTFSISKYDKILDVGCNTGGFIKYLKKINYENVYGIDISKQFLKSSELKNIYYGDLDDLRYGDKFFKIIVADQVLEHCVNPNKCLRDIHRILEDDGLLYLSVPNILSYKNDIFPFYWFIMREHIHHFNDMNLFYLLFKNGFEILKVENNSFVKIGEHSIDTIDLVARKTYKKREYYPYNKNVRVKHYIDSYIKESKKFLLFEKFNIIKWFIKSLVYGRKFVLYGVGRECLFVFNNTILKYFKNIIFSDSYEYKINNLKIDGRRIISNDQVDLEKNQIYITAYSHKKLIMTKLQGKNVS